MKVTVRKDYFFVKDQSVVKGEIDLDTFLIPISPTTVCFYFIAGCLGYSLPGQTSPVGQRFVENTSRRPPLWGGPVHWGCYS